MKNWKTTFTGIIGAIAVALIPIIQSGKFELKDLVIPIVIAALGVLAKDYDTTGAGKDAIKEK
jgi:hypothetical protein